MAHVEVAQGRSVRLARTRELRCHLCDSTLWNGLSLRDGDIVIASWAKSGTTWTQQIVGQLLFQGAEEVEVARISPWVDFRLGAGDRIAMLEAQTHRRFLKTYLPVYALGIDRDVRYIYLARDGRDAVWSLHNHYHTMKPERLAAINDAPGRVGPPLERPPESVRDWYRAWFERDGYPVWPYWDHVRGWWAFRRLPNVMLLHFNELKRDLPGAIRAIAAFLDLPVDEARLPAIVEHCSFGYMKAHAALVAPGGGIGWADGGASFIHKGENGRWRAVLTAEDRAAYEARAVAELGPEAAHWLATGEGPAAQLAQTGQHVELS